MYNEKVNKIKLNIALQYYFSSNNEVQRKLSGETTFSKSSSGEIFPTEMEDFKSITNLTEEEIYNIYLSFELRLLSLKRNIKTIFCETDIIKQTLRRKCGSSDEVVRNILNSYLQSNGNNAEIPTSVGFKSKLNMIGWVYNDITTQVCRTHNLNSIEECASYYLGKLKKIDNIFNLEDTEEEDVKLPISKLMPIITYLNKTYGSINNSEKISAIDIILMYEDIYRNCFDETYPKGLAFRTISDGISVRDLGTDTNYEFSSLVNNYKISYGKLNQQSYKKETIEVIHECFTVNTARQQDYNLKKAHMKKFIGHILSNKYSSLYEIISDLIQIPCEYVLQYKNGNPINNSLTPLITQRSVNLIEEDGELFRILNGMGFTGLLAKYLDSNGNIVYGVPTPQTFRDLIMLSELPNLYAKINSQFSSHHRWNELSKVYREYKRDALDLDKSDKDIKSAYIMYRDFKSIKVDDVQVINYIPDKEEIVMFADITCSTMKRAIDALLTNNSSILETYYVPKTEINDITYTLSYLGLDIDKLKELSNLLEIVQTLQSFLNPAERPEYKDYICMFEIIHDYVVQQVNKIVTYIKSVDLYSINCIEEINTFNSIKVSVIKELGYINTISYTLSESQDNENLDECIELILEVTKATEQLQVAKVLFQYVSNKAQLMSQFNVDSLGVCRDQKTGKIIYEYISENKIKVINIHIDDLIIERLGDEWQLS